MAVIQPFQPNSLFTTEDGKLTRDAYDFLNKIYLRIGGGLSSLNAATLETFTWEEPGTIGSTTPSTGKFTTLQATGHVTLEGVTSTGATGTGGIVFGTSPALTTPDLGTPTAIVLTNATGTAASLTAGHVTTNANLTGPITSVGNTTSIASQTGTGTKFVVDDTPTLKTPVIGVATATSVNKLVITAPATTATLTIANNKTLTASNTLTFTGTDGSTLNIGTGGTLGAGAFSAGGVTWLVKTANYTAVAGDNIYCDTTGGAFTITLPSTPSSTNAVAVASGPSCSTNNLTIGRNGQTIHSVASNLTISDNNVMPVFIFDGTTWGIA